MMNQKIAYYASGDNGSLEQPLIYGLKALGYTVRPWQGVVPEGCDASKNVFVFLGRAQWDIREVEQVKQLINAQMPCFIASPCKHTESENPCLKKTMDVFSDDLPIIFPPYDSENLANQLGVVPAASGEYINQVLLVDDSPSMLAVLEHYISSLGYQCFATVSANEALRHIEGGGYELLITDYQMDEMNGVELIEKSREVCAEIKSILITGFGDKATVLEAISIHVDAFLEKPVELDGLKDTLQRLERMINMRKENSRLMVELTESNSYLKEGRDILNATLECLNEAVLTLDNTYKIISANSALSQLSQYPVNHLLGKSIYDLLSEDVWASLTQKCSDVDVGVSVEGDVSRKDGSCFPARLTLRRSSEILRDVYIFVIQDITSQKEVQNNLISINEELESKVAERTRVIEGAKEEAERANKSKSEFLANMSHELRTPMHAIMSFNTLIEKGLSKSEVPVDITEKVKGFTHRISQSSKRLLRLINNLLDISKLESGYMEVHYGDHDILKIIQSVEQDISPLLSEKNLSIDVKDELDGNLIHLDVEKITQVFFNILSNACKFSPENSKINVIIEKCEVNVERRKSNPFWVDGIAVSICDSGVGVPQEELSHIFDKFIQSSKTKTGAGGTGLGLAICKEIIELHRGDIFAKNNSDSGACFQFKIPKSAIEWSLRESEA